MEKLAEILDTDANKLLSKACKSGNLQEMKKLVTEPDSSKKSSKVKKKLVGEYKATIQKLEKKLSWSRRKMRGNQTFASCWKCSIHDHIKHITWNAKIFISEMRLLRCIIQEVMEYMIQNKAV